MLLENSKNISCVVTEVLSYGLFLEFDNKEKIFLPKENMLVSKKKNLLDLFTVGFMMNVNIINKKKDYYIATQKEIKEVIIEESKVNNKKEKIKVKTKNNKKKENVDKKIIVEQANKIIEEKEEKQKNLTLNDLKKLKSVGNLKIKLQKYNKKTDKFEKEEQDKIVFLDVPKDFVENLVENYELRSAQFEELEKRVKLQRWLDEN